jgi:hypothetical protein
VIDNLDLKAIPLAKVDLIAEVVSNFPVELPSIGQP